MNDPRIPVTLLSGFLGSGKTTLLNHWLKQPELADSAVLINEFGSVGLDHHLVEKIDEQVVLLDSGCLCCSIQGSLVETLQGMFMKVIQGKIKPFNHLLIETTGLADPTPVLLILQEEGFIAQRYRFNGMLTLVDAEHIEHHLSDHYEAVKQVALADLLLLNKIDLVSPERAEQLKAKLAQLNPAAEIKLCQQGEITPDCLIKLGVYHEEAGKDYRKILKWLRSESPKQGYAAALKPINKEAAQVKSFAVAPTPPANFAHQNIQSFSLKIGEPIKPNCLFAALDAVQRTYGDVLLRLKGILQLEGEAQPMVVHGVYNRLYPLQSLGDWPEGKAQSNLVFIVDSQEIEAIKQLFLDKLLAPIPSLQEQIKQMLQKS